MYVYTPTRIILLHYSYAEPLSVSDQIPQHSVVRHKNNATHIHTHLIHVLALYIPPSLPHLSSHIYTYTGPWRLLRCDRVYESRVQQDQRRRGGRGEGERETGTCVYMYEQCIYMTCVYMSYIFRSIYVTSAYMFCLSICFSPCLCVCLLCCAHPRMICHVKYLFNIFSLIYSYLYILIYK